MWTILNSWSVCLSVWPIAYRLQRQMITTVRKATITLVVIVWEAAAAAAVVVVVFLIVVARCHCCLWLLSSSLSLLLLSYVVFVVVLSLSLWSSIVLLPVVVVCYHSWCLLLLLLSSSVSLSARVTWKLCSLSSQFFVLLPGPWLGPPVPLLYCDTWCTSGFVDDVQFSCNRLYDASYVFLFQTRVYNFQNYCISSSHILLNNKDWQSACALKKLPGGGEGRGEVCYPWMSCLCMLTAANI